MSRILTIILLVSILLVSSPARAQDPPPAPSTALYLPAIYPGDYYEVTCPDAGAEVCPAGGSGITPVKRRIH